MIVSDIQRPKEKT